MNRFELRQLTQVHAEQSRWLWWRVPIIGAAIIVGVLIVWFYRPALWAGIVGAACMVYVIVASTMAAVMFGRLPELPEPEMTDVDRFLEWQSSQRPMVQLQNRVLVLNLAGIVTPEQWRMIRHAVIRNNWYISRSALARVKISNEKYTELREELVRVHALEKDGNVILPQARHLFSPTPQQLQEVDGPSRTDGQPSS